MMSGSNRPHASSGLLTLTTVWACLIPLLNVAPAGAAGARPPVVRFAGGATSGPGEREWLQEDARWLAGLPAAARVLVAPLPSALDDTTAVAAWLRLVRGDLTTAGGAAVRDSTVRLQPVDVQLRDRWLARGYLEASVGVRRAAPGVPGSAPDTLLVTPGPVWRMGTLNVDGEDFPGRDHLLATWLPHAGDRFSATELEQAIDRVLAGAGDAGRPFARWVTKSLQLNQDSKLVDIEAGLLAGYAAWLGPISTSLPPGRASDFAVRTSGLRPGAPYRESDLARAVDRLLARDLYAQVDAPVVHLTTAVDTVGVYLPLAPRPKANRLQVILGLSRGEEGKNRLSGQVDLDLPNLAGTGRALQVGWRDDGAQTSRFGFRYLEPLAFGTPLDTDIALDSEVLRDVYTRFRLENRWRLPVVALWGVEVGGGSDRSTYPTGALERTRRLRARGALYHRRGDRSRSGWEGVFAVEEAWRSSTARADTAGGSTAPPALGLATNQRIYEVDVSGEVWAGSGLSFFARGAFRELAGGGGEVPLDEQFRFGGANTLRGHREDEFHGSRAAWGAVELRIGSARGSRLYTFYDLGYFAFGTRDPLADDPAALILREGWPRGYGLGIFARTPGGDLSLAVGFPGTVDFDLAKLHVTLMESF